MREQLAAAFDRCRPGPIRLLSLCAGEARDVAPVVAAHPRGTDVVGRLVELDPQLCARTRAAVPAAIEVVEADAGSTSSCVGAAPADVLLLCGIFGNVPDADIATTIAALPALLAPGGTVIWTRHTRPPDLTPSIRTWLADVGAEEVAFVSAPPPGWSVGAAVARAPSVTLVPEQRLFAFRPDKR